VALMCADLGHVAWSDTLDLLCHQIAWANQTSPETHAFPSLKRRPFNSPTDKFALQFFEAAYIASLAPLMLADRYCRLRFGLGLRSDGASAIAGAELMNEFSSVPLLINSLWPGPYRLGSRLIVLGERGTQEFAGDPCSRKVRRTETS